MLTGSQISADVLIVDLSAQRIEILKPELLGHFGRLYKVSCSSSCEPGPTCIEVKELLHSDLTSIETKNKEKGKNDTLFEKLPKMIIPHLRPFLGPASKRCLRWPRRQWCL